MLRVFVLFACLALPACITTYTPPSGTDPRCTWETPRTFDETWQAVVETFAAENTPIKTIEKASGIAQAEQQFVPEATTTSYVDLGEIGTRSVVDVITPKDHHRDYFGDAWLTYNVFVKKTDRAQTVSVSTTWRGTLELRYVNPLSGVPMVQKYTLRGISTGEFERQLLAKIANRLGVSEPLIQIAGGPLPRPKRTEPGEASASTTFK